MKILILTALELVFQSIKSFLNNVKAVRHPETGSTYEQGTYEPEGNTFDVLIVETRAGNIRAADETGRAIQYFKPNYVFFVGVAGGIKDVKLGDVVASTKVIGYEIGKDEASFKPRFDSVPSSYILEQTVRQVKRDKRWTVFSKGENKDITNAYVQAIAAG